MTKTTFLMGASALVAASLALASAATAGSVPANILYGTGSSLDAPYLAEIEGCFGTGSPLDIQGATVTTPGTTVTYTICKKPVGQKSTVSNYSLRFMSSSSGFGEAAIFSNSAASYAGETSTGAVYPGLEYGAGDYGLGGDVAKYVCLSGPCTVGSGASAVTVAQHGVAPTSGQFANPQDTYGSVIQFPLLITPVVLAYNPVYRATYAKGKTTYYSFNLHTKNADKSGGLQLDIPTICAIFNGKITNWNDPAITALNGGVSLKATTDTATFSVPIELVGRSDSSGTTSIFYRALAAQCDGTYNGGTYTNNYAAAGGKTLPTALLGPNVWPGSGPTEPVVAGKFTTTKGSPNIALYVGNILPIASATIPTAVQGKLAYIGPDYTLPAAKNTKAPGGLNMNVVDIVTGGVAIEPTAATALAAFTAAGGASGLLPPQTDSSGAYDVSATSVGVRSAPQDWAEPISTTVTYSNGSTAVATPLAAPPAGYYPLVGTSNFFLYTCYNSAGTVGAMDTFLTYYYGNPKGETTTVLNQAGLALLPTAWSTAILGTFVNDPNSLKLAISAAGTGSQCSASTIVGAN
jgi:ABC-type phosphate transport system substrate-binding protein